MRYIDGEAAYFRAFVVGDFDAYVSRMCQPGEWGDHLEIQALSEVYDMPIEIYAYSTHPLRTYSRQDGSDGGGASSECEWCEAAGDAVELSLSPATTTVWWRRSERADCSTADR